MMNLLSTKLRDILLCSNSQLTQQVRTWAAKLVQVSIIRKKNITLTPMDNKQLLIFQHCPMHQELPTSPYKRNNWLRTGYLELPLGLYKILVKRDFCSDKGDLLSRGKISKQEYLDFKTVISVKEKQVCFLQQVRSLGQINAKSNQSRASRKRTKILA